MSSRFLAVSALAVSAGLSAALGAGAQPTFRALVDEFPGSTAPQQEANGVSPNGRYVVGTVFNPGLNARVGFYWDTNPTNPSLVSNVGTLAASPANRSSALWAVSNTGEAFGTSTVDPLFLGGDRFPVWFTPAGGLTQFGTLTGAILGGGDQGGTVTFDTWGYQANLIVGQGIRRVPAYRSGFGDTLFAPSANLRGQFLARRSTAIVGSTRDPGAPGGAIDGLVYFIDTFGTVTIPNTELVAITRDTDLPGSQPLRIYGTDLSGVPKAIVRELMPGSLNVGNAVDLFGQDVDPFIPPNRYTSAASSNGRIVFGYANDAGGIDNGDFAFTNSRAWVHFQPDPNDPGSPALSIDLTEHLRRNNVPMGDWTLQRVAASSNDGTIVVGRAFSLTGNRRSAFIATVPPRNSVVDGARRLVLDQFAPTDFRLYGSDRRAICGPADAAAAYFAFTAPETDWYRFDGVLAGDTVSAVATSGQNAFDILACGTGPLTVPLRGGTRVLFRVAASGGLPAVIRNLVVVQLPPQNTCCVGGPQILAAPANFAAERGFPAYYRYVVGATGSVTVRACDGQIPVGGMGQRDRFRVRIATTCNGCGTGGTLLGQVDSQDCPGSAVLTVPVTAGSVLAIEVSAINNPLATVTGALGQISVSQSPCGLPQNDSYQSRVFNSGPSGYWRLSESWAAVTTAADEIFRGTDTCGRSPGTYAGATNFFSTPSPIVGLGLTGKQFSGTRRISNIALMPTANDTPRSEAIEAWVRTTNPLAGTVLTGRDADAVTSHTLVVGAVGPFQFPGRAAFLLDGPGVIRGAVGTTNIADGNWHHVVGTRDFFVDFGTGQLTLNYRLYVNGRLEGLNNVTTGNLSTLVPTAATNWSIGDHPAWRNAGLTDFFQGDLAEVAAFNGRQTQPNPNAVLSTSLTAAEIAARYNTATGTCKPLLPTDVSGGLFALARAGRTVSLVVPIFRGPVTNWSWSRGGTTLVLGPTGNGGTYTSVAGANSEWTQATLTIQNVGFGDAGSYTVRVATPCPDFSEVPFNLTVFCRFDYTFDGQRTPADIFSFLNQYFAGSPEADFDANGVRNPTDIFSFLNAYFANQCV